MVVAGEGGGGCRGGGSGAGGGVVDDPHSVGSRGDELGNGVGQGRVRVDVEDWVGILAVVHAARGEDDGDEVDAGIFEEWGRAGLGEKLFE